MTRRYFDGDVIGTKPQPTDQWSDLPLAAARAVVHDATEAGIQTAHDHANAQWKQTAYSAIVELARRQPILNADDVWRHLSGATTSTHNGSALGPLFRIAASRGVIRKRQGDLVQSTLLKDDGSARRHREIQQWDSLIHDRRTVERMVHGGPLR